MSNKFEKLLDYLVNEEMDKANELFHEIVVEKSRTIYENLISEEAREEDEEDDESMEEAREEDESMEEAREEDEEDESMEESWMSDESVYEIGGDPADDLEHDTVDHDAPGTFGMGGEEDHDSFGDDDMGGDHDMMGDDDMGGDHDMMGGDDEPVTKGDLEAIEDSIVDKVVSALKNTKGAEVDFGDDDMGDDDMGDDFGGEDGEDDSFDFDDEDDEDDEEDEEDEEDEGEMNLDESFLREYSQVVRSGKDYTAGSPGEEGSVHKKSAIATGGPGINTKANAKNIAQNDREGDEDGTKPKGKAGGLVGTVKGEFTDSSTLNVNKNRVKGDGYNKAAKAHKTGENQVNDKSIVAKRSR